MSTSEKSIIVDAGNDADYVKLKADGFTAAYFDCRDPRLTPTYLGGVRDKGIWPGLFVAWNWWPDLTGLEFATAASSYVKKLGDTTYDFPRVLLDIEDHDVKGYLLPALETWRKLRPKRTTAWTLEAYQGGLFSPTDALRIAACRLLVAPSFYLGDMTPLDAVDVILNLCSASFAPGQLTGMYDAARLPSGGAWSGFAFTQGRLP